MQVSSQKPERMPTKRNDLDKLLTMLAQAFIFSAATILFYAAVMFTLTFAF